MRNTIICLLEQNKLVSFCQSVNQLLMIAIAADIYDETENALKGMISIEISALFFPGTHTI